MDKREMKSEYWKSTPYFYYFTKVPTVPIRSLRKTQRITQKHGKKYF